MKPFFAIARFLTGIILKLGGFRVFGRENIPKDGPLLVICNHVSFGDPLAMVNAFPRQLTFIAKEEFLHNPFTKILFSSLGVVFLQKSDNDMVAMRVAMKELKAGNVVAIFPEGTRHFDQNLGAFMPGAAYIAHRTGVKVLPMAVVNSGDYFRFWRRNIILSIGEPIELSNNEKLSNDLLEVNTALFKERIKTLFDEACNVLQKEGRKMRLKKQKKTS